MNHLKSFLEARDMKPQLRLGSFLGLGCVALLLILTLSFPGFAGAATTKASGGDLSFYFDSLLYRLQLRFLGRAQSLDFTQTGDDGGRVSETKEVTWGFIKIIYSDLGSGDGSDGDLGDKDGGKNQHSPPKGK